MSLDLSPARRDIVLQRGSTPRLRVRLTSRHLPTGELTGRPVAGDVVEWTLFWPDGVNGGPKVLTTGAEGELAIDPVSRVITCPFSEADILKLPAVGIPYTVAIRNADGLRFRWLEGSITATGRARPST